jgi:solute carrier family 25 protein 42
MTGREVTTIERMQCGAFSGLIAQTITYPIEVTRRRMQVMGMVGTDTAFGQLGAVGLKKGPELPPTIGVIIRSIYTEGGIYGFFKGVSLNWGKGPIAFGISFTMFDTIQRLLEPDHEKRQRRI